MCIERRTNNRPSLIKKEAKMRRVKCVLCMYADALRTEMLSTLEFRTGSRSSTLALHFGCVFVRMIVCMHDNITTNLIVAPHVSPESMEILSFVPARVFSMYVCCWRVLGCVCVCAMYAR